MSNPTDKESVTALLLPCPFCGGTDLRWFGIRDGESGGCNSRECGAQVIAFHPNARAKIAAKWNARALSPAQGDGMREALVEIASWLRNGDYDTRGGLIEMDRLASIAEAALASHPDRQPGMTDEAKK